MDQTVDGHLPLVQIFGDLHTVGAVHQLLGDLQAPQPLSEITKNSLSIFQYSK